MRNSSLYFADVLTDLFLNYGHFPGVRVSRTLPAAAVPEQAPDTRRGISAPSLAAGLPPQTPEKQKIPLPGWHGLGLEGLDWTGLVRHVGGVIERGGLD